MSDPRSIYDQPLTHEKPISDRKLIVVLLLCVIAVLVTVCLAVLSSKDAFTPDETIYVSAELLTELDTLFEVSELTYAAQDFSLTAKDNGTFRLRVYVRDDTCQSYSAHLQTVSLEPVITKELILDWVGDEDHKSVDGNPLCKYSAGNLDAKLTPGIWVLFINGERQPVTITVFKSA